MIKNIKTVKRFGIFQDYSNSGTQDFGKFNLIYGWNGSGKSTLSTLFRCLETKSLTDRFSVAEFTIVDSNNQAITNSNISTSTLNIHTFNQDFIRENISWDEVVKSILLIDKEKISERERLESLKKLQDKATKESESRNQEILTLDSTISKFETESARHLKTSLQAIDTSDRYYLNYDKRKFESFIAENAASIGGDEALLNKQQILDLTNAAKPDQKSALAFNPQALNESKYVKAKESLDEILKTSILSKTISRLTDNADIKDWVEAGLDLHKTHKSDKCEFCGNVVLKERIEQIEAHFNDSYKAFKSRLEKADQWLGEQFIQPSQLAPASDLYEELRESYIKACSSLGVATKSINSEISVWHAALKKKTENQFETTLAINALSASNINDFNASMMAIDSIIKKHNHKTSNFQAETSKAKKKLELHYAATEIKKFGYHKKKNETAKKKSDKATVLADILRRKAEIQSLEQSLSNESIGAIQFNEDLHKFLGRSDLSLQFNPVKKGYEIIRNDTEPCKGHLSEGEKTAIAFVYFITKLKENDNSIQNTIVVVDDPVSSFDSNHLFHSYSFLRNNCKDVMQLFVMTHNFTFFKLVRDWFAGVNRNRAKKIPAKAPNAFFYTIETTTAKPRTSTLVNADSSLEHYNSEYHYLFSKLFKYKEQSNLSRDDAFLTANLSRKLLESFFSFKYPRHRGDVAQLMDSGLKGCKITNETIKEKIYRFINKYSHSIVIDTNEDSSESLTGESNNIIGDIFTWIKEVDETHYNEMVEVAS